MASLSDLLPASARRDGAGRLVIGGCSVVDLSEEYGTPLYLYDQATLDTALAEYRTALTTYWPGTAEIAYAAKAWLSLAMAQWAARRELGLDVVSHGEMEIARRAGFPPERMHAHGNNKPALFLDQAIAAGVGRIVVDGEADLEATIEAARRQGRRQAIWLRLNLGVAAGTHRHVETGGATTKFGLSFADGSAHRAARRALGSPDVELLGLHMHIGSQIADPAPLVAAIERVLDFAAVLTSEQDWQWRELSPGGGWAVPYVPGGPRLAPEHALAALSRTIADRCRQTGLRLPHLVLEPGRELVARAGVALYRVGMVKRAGTVNYAFVDGGLGDNPRPTLYEARYTAVLANREAPPSSIYTLAGPYCESGDVLIRELYLPELYPGDLLAVPVSGAYQLSMASTYNGIPRPAVLWLNESGSWFVQRRESIDDLLARDRPLDPSIL
ncbi:MAG TPA: diaminopimelate decarboxylase [Ardenticatenaceae bacterium]|nr:diaminopimelate decarboxylase [Ardenticatenaceae bacterium]